MKRLPISVCMISGAEAARIGRALESVAGWTQEIVIVLNESVNDGTEEIALKHGARVFREPWKGHVAQKNSAAEKTAQEWILGLDADEVVSEKLREEIERALAGESRANDVAAFSFPRLSWYCGRWIRHGDWYPDRKTRLWKRGKGSWAGVDPHDKLVVAGRVEKLHGDLYHFTNDSIAQHVQKIVPYADEFVRRNLASGQKPGFFALVMRPIWRFVRAYFFRLGFLDGWQGYYIACLNAFSSVTRYARLREPKPGNAPPSGPTRSG